MKIAMVASECNPFIKTGGLADVVYALSKELAVNGEEVAVFLPLYTKEFSKVHGKSRPCGNVDVSVGWRKETANIFKTFLDGITFYFVEDQHYFERDNIYGYFDDGERFAFFNLAVEKAMEAVKFKPDIIHVHDWQTAMLPCLLKCKQIEFYKNTKYVLSIHNPAFLGLLERNSLSDLYSLDMSLFYDGAVRFYDQVSTLKAGIVFSDKIITVSPTHREELLTPEGSKGLDGVLRLRENDFLGILNGIDYMEFNPSEDPHLDNCYSISNFVSKKALNKKSLVEGLGLYYNADQPLFGLVSRITWQKGFDIIFNALEELIRRGAMIVILGSGEYGFERRLEELRSRYPDNLAIFIGYNDKLAHKIYGSSDFFLMPSLFEPCGLGQMIAQRYGTLPIVRLTGGLKDSVINFDSSNEETSNGFGFASYDENEMTRTCIYAYDNYQNAPLIRKLMRNAMKTDNSWQKSVKEYMKVYKDLLG